jgi:hypothetical protein
MDCLSEECTQSSAIVGRWKASFYDSSVTILIQGMTNMVESRPVYSVVTRSSDETLQKLYFRINLGQLRLACKHLLPLGCRLAVQRPVTVEFPGGGNGCMRIKGLILLCFLPAAVNGLYSQSITGTILIKRRLTKPSVTASVSVYQRGTVVDLGKDAEQDPIAYERSRVVVYLESPAAPGKTFGAPPAVQIEQLNRRHDSTAYFFIPLDVKAEGTDRGVKAGGAL